MANQKVARLHSIADNVPELEADGTMVPKVDPESQYSAAHAAKIS